MMKKTLFKKNVAQFKDLIYSQAYYFTGNSEDAADITQEVLLKLWNYLERIQQNAVKSWLLKVTRNQCIDYSRRKRELAVSFVAHNSEENEYPLNRMDEGLNPEQNAINQDLKDKISFAIHKLPPKIKNVIILREIHDLKYEDIASSMEIPTNSVKAYLHRGRKLLFKYLQPYYPQG